METNIENLQMLIMAQEEEYEQKIKNLEAQLTLTENHYKKVVEQNKSLQERSGFYRMQLASIKNLTADSPDKICRIVYNRCKKALA